MKNKNSLKDFIKLKKIFKNEKRNKTKAGENYKYFIEP